MIQESPTNSFKLAVITQANYKVYLSLHPDSSSRSLSEAELLLRHDNPTVLATQHNKELWIFSLSEKALPPEPNPKFNLKETTTGVFLPSMISQQLNFPSSGLGINSVYVALVKAIRKLVIHNFTKLLNFVPFGKDVLLLNEDGGRVTELTVESCLSPLGEVILFLSTRKTTLYSLSRFKIGADLSLPSDKSKYRLYLAPSGVTATLANNTLDESIVPSPDNAQAFKLTLELTTGKKLHNFEWVELIPDYTHLTTFQKAVGVKLLWPMELCYIQLSQQQIDISNLRLFRMKDVLSQVEDFLKAIIEDETPPNILNRGDLPALDMKNRQNVNLVYPTPPDPLGPKRSEQEDQDQEMNDAQAPENQDKTPNQPLGDAWSDLNEELFGAEEEVTEADFNFFDEPDPELELEPDPKPEPEPQPEPKTEPENESEIEPKRELASEPKQKLDLQEIKDETMDKDESTLIRNKEESCENPINNKSKEITTELNTRAQIPMNIDLVIPPNPNSSPKSAVSDYFSTSPNSSSHTNPISNPLSLRVKQNSAFAPLNFNPLIRSSVDQKYASGGRFFVPNEKGKDMDSDSSYESEDSDESYEIENDVQNDLKKFHNRSREESVDLPNKKQCVSTITTTSQAVQNKLTLRASPEWLPLLLKTVPSDVIPEYLVLPFPELDANSPLNGTDLTSTLQILSQQITWDDDLLLSLVSPNFKNRAPSANIINVLPSLFKKPQNLDLIDLIKTENENLPNELYNEKGIPPKTDFNSNKNINNNDMNSSENIFLVPQPQFIIRRLSQTLKVNAPALRFWKPFGFTPKHGPKDVSLVFIYPESISTRLAASQFLESIKGVYESCGLGNVTMAEFDDVCQNGLLPISYENSLNSDNNLQTTLNNLLNEFASISIKIGALLNQVNVNTNFMILVANPISHVQSLFHLSQCLNLLSQQAFKTHLGVNSSHPNNNNSHPNFSLAFQIIPCHFFINDNKLTIPSQFRLSRFAMTLYDKITPSEQPSTDSTEFKGIANLDDLGLQRPQPRTTLPRIPPSRINFKISPVPSQSLLMEDSYLHICYSRSSDKRWVCCAWTDQWGEISKVESFLLAPSKSSTNSNSDHETVISRPFEDVCTDLWEKTLAITRTLPVRWWIVLAKLGIMEDDELSMWQGIVSQVKNLVVTYASVNVRPNISFKSPSISKNSKLSFETSGNCVGPNAALSTGSTGPNTTTPFQLDSPDLYSTAIVTPSKTSNTMDDVPDDTLIVDVNDIIYGIILKHRMPILSKSLLNSNQGSGNGRVSIVTGYLLNPSLSSVTGISRLGVNDTGKDIDCLEVSILATPVNYAAMIKTILQHYRSLVSLGYNSGVISRNKNNIYAVERNGVVPWHVEAVRKVMDVLQFLEV